MDPQSNKLSNTEFELIGVPRKLYSSMLGSLDNSILVDAQWVIDNRGWVTITGDINKTAQVGFSILRAMLDTKDYLDYEGRVDVEKIRYIQADSFISRLNTADFDERRALWKNLFTAYDDGSGWVRSIMIEGLGEEFGRDAVNNMKLIIRRCDSDLIQLIVETSLDTDELADRYGKRVGHLLYQGKLIKL